MNSPEVCFVCFATDVKIYPRDSVLDVYIENLFGNTIYKSTTLNCTMSTMLTGVCYECAFLLRKFHKFRKKFLVAQGLLYELMESVEQISKEDIKKIDRKALKLESNLTVQFYTLMNTIDIVSNLDMEIKHESKELLLLEDAINNSSPHIEKVLSDDDKIGDGRDYSDFDDDDVPLKNLKDIAVLNVKNEPDTIDDFVSEIVEKKVNNSKSKTKKASTKTDTKKKGQTKRNKTKDADDLSRVSGFIRDPSKIDELAKDFEIIKFTTLEEQIAEMEKRKETANYKMSQYKCEHCYRGFMHADTLKNHLVYHEPKKGHMECPLCHMYIYPRSKFRQHALRHNTKFQCRTCDFYCAESNQASRHAQWHKGVEYSCEFCPATFKKLTSQQTHIRTQHRTEHVCATCGYSFVSQRGLKMHQAKMHRDTYTYRKKALPPLSVPEHEKSSRLYCAQCDMKLADDDAWARHMATSDKHKHNGSVSCRHCGQQFSSREARGRHHCAAVRRRPRCYMRRYNNLTRDYPRQCELCPVQLHSRQQHYKHYQKEHTDAVYPHAAHNYICELCGKGFGILQVLKQHRLKHLSLRTFSCSLCPKAFYNNTQLKLHLQSHSTNRPHPCPLCGKCFKTNISLYAHVKRHEGVRRFSCQYCGKAFTTAPNMRQHIKHVHMNLADKPQPAVD